MLETKEECDIMKIKREIILFGLILTVLLISNISQGIAQGSTVPFKKGDKHTFTESTTQKTTAKDSSGKMIYDISTSGFNTLDQEIHEVNTTMNYLNVSSYSTYRHDIYYSTYTYNGTQSFFDGFARLLYVDYTTNYGQNIIRGIYTYSSLIYLYLNMTAIKKGFQNAFNTSRVVYYYNSTSNETLGSLLASADSYKFMDQSTIADGLAKIDQNTRTFSFEITFSNKIHYYSTDEQGHSSYNKTYSKYSFHISLTYDNTGVLKNSDYGITTELTNNGNVETGESSYKINQGSSTGSSTPGFEFIPVLTGFLLVTIVMRKIKKK